MNAALRDATDSAAQRIIDGKSEADDNSDRVTFVDSLTNDEKARLVRTHPGWASAFRTWQYEQAVAQVEEGSEP